MGFEIIIGPPTIQVEISSAPQMEGENLGTGAGVFKDRDGRTLRFKSIAAGSNISITEGSEEITIASTGSAATSFLALTDTPNSYVGQSLLAVRVNTAETGLEFYTPSTGSGTVTSFSAGNLSPLFTTSVANSTTTPALTFALSTQSANLVFAGPTSGGAATPTFRALVSGDIPDLSSIYQPLDADLTAIAALGFTSTSFLKKTALNTWSLDTTVYLPLTGGTMSGNITFGTGLGIDSSATLNVGATNATTVNVGTGSGNTAINIGTAGTNTIQIGNSNSTVNILGTVLYDNVTNLQVKDKLFTVNKDGAAASGSGAGFEIEENSSITGYFKTTGGRDGFLLRAPGNSADSSFILSATSATSYTFPNASGTVAVSASGNIALSVAGDISFTGDLPFSNLTQIVGLSVLGVTGSITADVAAITGTANQVLRVNSAGNALAFGTISSASVDETIWKVGGNTLTANAIFGDISSGGFQISFYTKNTARFVIDANGNQTNSQTAQSTTNIMSTFTQAVHTGGSPSIMKLIGGAHTGLTVNAEAPDIYFNLARTVQFTGGAGLSTQRSIIIEGVTYSATSAKTVTTVSTLYVDPPVASTNMTITDAYAINSGGRVLISGAGSATKASLLIKEASGSAKILLDIQKASSVFKVFQEGNITSVLSTAGPSNAGVYDFSGTTTFSFSTGGDHTSLFKITSAITLSVGSDGTNIHSLFNLKPTITATSFTTGEGFYGIYYAPSFTSLTKPHAAWYHSSGYIQWASVLSPSQITSNQDNYDPTGWSSGGSPNGASILRLSTDASRNLTSLAGGVIGRLVIIANVGSFDLVIKNDDGATGTAANRFALAADITLASKKSLMFWYDSTSSRWRANTL